MATFECAILFPSSQQVSWGRSVMQRWRLYSVILIICLLFAGTGAITPGVIANDAGHVLRSLPPDAGCGETLTVSLEIEPPPGTSAWLVEEVPPAGVLVVRVDASHNGHVNDDGTVSWVSTSGEPARLSYDIRMPTNATGGLGSFEGTYRFHDHMEGRSQVAGATGLDLRCGSVLRVLPAAATCGTTIEVGISLAPPSGTDSWVVEEMPPATLAVVDVDPTDNGKFVEENGAVNWISTSGGGALKSYAVAIPLSAPDGAVLAFEGEFRFHPGMTDRAAIGGDQNLTIDCPPTPPPGTVPSVDDLVPAEPGAPFVTRFLPQQARCGESFFVGLGVAPPHNTSAWVLVETPPPEVLVTHLDPAHMAEEVPSLGDLKWVSVTGNSSVLVYQVTVLANVTEGTVLNFTGASRAHPHMESRVPVIGHELIEVTCPRSSGGGGGGGSTSSGPAPFGLGAPGDEPSELLASATDPPDHAAWRATTPPLTGPIGGKVLIRFPDDPEGMEVLFESGTVFDGAVLTITRWAVLPEDLPVLPGGFDARVIVTIEIEGGPRKGHEVHVSSRIDDGDTPGPMHGAVLAPDAPGWSVIGPAVIETVSGEKRLVADSPCCSTRVIGFDRTSHEIDLQVIDEGDNETLRIETTIVDNLGIDFAELYHNGSFVARLDAPRGGYIFDLQDLAAGNHTFEVKAFDQTGRSAQASLVWFHDPLGPAGTGPESGSPPVAAWPWVLLALIALLGAIGGLTIHRRKTRAEMEEALESPALSLTATTETPPEGAMMARRIIVSGAKGSGANVLLDDRDVPTLALFLGERLDKVPVDVTRWHPHALPEALSGFPSGATPLILLRVALPPETKGNYPVLVTVALPEEEVVHPSWIALLTHVDGAWETVDRFKFTLDPDGLYRGSALAEDQGWLLVAVCRPEDSDAAMIAG